MVERKRRVSVYEEATGFRLGARLLVPYPGPPWGQGCARDQGLTLVQFSAQLKPFFLWDTLGGVGQQVTERLNLS
jgi:hypothetical protein